jgi:hypothetical protein
MNSNSNKKWEIIYPENSSNVIAKLMEKYGLKETPKDILEKIDRGEITIGEKIAGIVAETVENELLLEDVVSKLEQNLNIPRETAEKLAEDLKKEILDRVEKILMEESELLEKEEEIPLSKKRLFKKGEILPEKPLEEIPKKPQKGDIYREPIE